MKKYKMVLSILVVMVLVIGTSSIVLAADNNKLAVIFPGSIQDADWNAIGFRAMRAAEKELGMEVAWSEKVSVPDSSRVMGEYAADDYGIVWGHGAQFSDAIQQIAPEYPETIFILEADAPLEEEFDNIITFGRNYPPGFYVIGALAAMKTETNHIGYIGGLELPFTYGEMNAMYQAIQVYNPDAKIHYVYAGDFNDSVKARQCTESLLAKDCDIIVSALNLGNYGVFRALDDCDRDVWLTSTFTDKYNLAPDHFLTSVLYNFRPPLFKAIDMIKAGEKSAYLPLQFGEGKGVSVKLPVYNVSNEINNKINEISKKVENEEIEVIYNLSTLEIND